MTYFSSTPRKIREAIEAYHREVGALTENAERHLVLEVRIRCEHDVGRLVVNSEYCEINGRPGQRWDGSWRCADCGIILPKDYGEYTDLAVRRRAAAEVLSKEFVGSA